MSKNIIIIILFLSLFSITTQVEWNIEMLLNATYENMTKTNNSLSYYLMDPDGIFSEKEYIQLQKDLLTFSTREEFIPYFFIVKSFDIKGITNKNEYFEKTLKQIELYLTMPLMQNYINYQELFIAFVSIKENIISVRANTALNNRLSNYSLGKIKKNGEEILKKNDYIQLFRNILEDVSTFIDNDYDYIDDKKEKDPKKKDDDDDNDNPFWPYHDDDDEEVEEEDPWKDFNPKKPEKKDDKKEDKKDDKIDEKKEKDVNKINDKKNEDSFYKLLAWILIFIIFVIGIILYFIMKKFKILNRKNINYQQLMGVEFNEI